MFSVPSFRSTAVPVAHRQRAFAGSACRRAWLLSTSSSLTTSHYCYCAAKRVCCRPQIEVAGYANKHAEEPRSVLLRIAYQSANIPYQKCMEGQSPSVMGLDGTGSEGVSACFAFSHMVGFTPVQMEVQRASTLREAIGARVCLLGRDRSVYKTFALPEDWDEGSLRA
jgi:hypothetical protein